MVYYSERLHVERAVYAGQLIREGAIGKVIQVLGLGPHRLNAPSRPDWFFIKENYGGILCDIGSHQIEQFLFYAGETDATVVRSQIGNYAHPQYPELDDFGDAHARRRGRCDAVFPRGLVHAERPAHLGRRPHHHSRHRGVYRAAQYINVGTDDGSNQVFLVNGEREQKISVAGKVGYPFFGELILDCINRTENAMTQAHAFKAAELCLIAQRRGGR